jgi:hypothetical protein
MAGSFAAREAVEQFQGGLVVPAIELFLDAPSDHAAQQIFGEGRGRGLTEHFGPSSSQFVLAEGSQRFNLGSDLSFLVHGRIGVSKDRGHQAAPLRRSHSRRSSSRLTLASTSSGICEDGVVGLVDRRAIIRHYRGCV